MAAVEYSNKKKLPTKWIPPKKPAYRESLLEDDDIKQAILSHSRQPYLDRTEKDRLKNTYKKQLCLEMLFEGYQKSFRELNHVLKLQIDDRYRLGTDHPIWEKPLLDQESEKLSYLCAKFNQGEDAERNQDYKTVYKSYLDLANYFLLTDDIWLSDYFFEKCLSTAQDRLSESDPELLADAHCNLGLAYERLNSYQKAVSQFQSYFDLTQGKDWKVKHHFSEFSKPDRDRILAIKRSNVEEGVQHFLDDRMFKDACIHLGRLYKIISDRFATDHEEKIEYLSKAYDVCKSSSIKTLEGQASLVLGNAYSECSRLEIAIPFYNNYYEISKKEKDLENFGIASEALAKCNEKLGHVNKSIDYLQKYLNEVSNNEADKQYARACNCLANIYNSLGKYETATNYSKKAFDISRQINQREATEYNRVLYGISKGHKMLKHFNDNVELNTRKTINNLLKWKYGSTDNCEKTLMDK